MGNKNVNLKLTIQTIAKDTGMSKLTKNMERLQKSMSKEPKGFKKITASIKEARDYTGKWQDRLKDPKAVAAIEKMDKAMKAYTKDVERVNALQRPVAKTYVNHEKFAQAVRDASRDVTKYTKILPALSVAMNVVGVVAGQVSRKFKQWAGQIRGVGQSLQQLWAGLKNSIGAFRLVSQGILTVARSMTFFVAAPMALFLKNATKAALKMEDALIRVAKVTGDLFKEAGSIAVYRDELAKLAVVSASSMEQLAKFTEQLGQMGLADKGAMVQMVAIMDVVANATDIAADSIANDLGSIANAFGYSLSFTGKQLEETIFFIDRTAEVINALENSAGTTASEVVNMLKDVGSSLAGLTTNVDGLEKALEMNVGQIAGWLTVGREMGMTADEVGTAMRMLPYYLVKNADEIGKLNIQTDRFATTQEFLNGLHTDFYSTVDSLIQVLAADDDALATVSASTALLGRRSGRLIQNLVKANKEIDLQGDGLTRYNKIMEAAADAWENGGTLMAEYDKALASTTVKTQMLKNGFENLSIVVGDDIIPVLNGLIDIASAGALAFSQLYKTLDTGTKKTVAKFVSFAALYGPVSWFLSQTVFGISMVINGIMRLGAFITPLLGLFTKLVGGLFTLNPVLILIGGTLYKLFSNYTGGVQAIADKVDDVFVNLNKNVGKWSETLMDTFAGGIVEGSKAVMAAVSSVAQIIASFLEAHSPPEQGPLSSINMWGAVLMNTYLKGFAQADFGILSDVAGKIEGILSSLHFTPTGDDDTKERKNVLKGLIAFREQFTKLLKDNRQGKKITDAYLDSLLTGFGDSKDEVMKLVKAHLALERVQRRLAEIEEERYEVNERYVDQVQTIRLSGKTAEEMVEAIASAGYERDQNLSALSEEEQLLERREEMFAAQLELQQELMDALQEQSDLWKELLTLQEQSAGGAGDEAGDTRFGGISTPDLEGMSDKLKEAQLRFIDLNVQATKFKIVLFAIIEYLKGMWAVIFTGADPSTVFEGMEERIKEASGATEAAKGWLDDYAAAWGSLETPEEFEEFGATWGQKIADSLSSVLTGQEAVDAVSDWVDATFPEVADEVKDGLVEAIKLGMTDVTSVEWELLGDVEFDMPVVGSYDIEVLDDLSDMGEFFGKFIPVIQGHADGLAPVGEKLMQGVTDLFAAMGAGYVGVTTPTLETPAGFDFDPDVMASMADGGISDNPMVNIGEAIGEFARILMDNVPGILDNLGSIAESLTDFFIVLFGGDPAAGGENLLERVGTLLETIDEKLEDYVLDITPAGIKWDLAKTAITITGTAILAKSVGTAIVGAISTWLVSGVIGSMMSTIATQIGVWALTAGPAIGTAIATFFAGITIPVWGLVAAIAALIAAVVLLGPQAWESAKMLGAIIGVKVSESWVSTKDIFATGWEDTKAEWDKTKEDIGTWWEGVSSWFAADADIVTGGISIEPPDRTAIEGFISWAEDTAGPAITTFFETTIPSAFTTFVETIGGFGTTLFDKGKSAAKSLAKGFFDIIQKLINAYNIKIAETWLGDMLNIPTINITMPNVDQWQGGGRPVAGAMGVIGEAGRELFSAPVAGKITSHSLTEKMLRDVDGSAGGGGTVINVNIDSPTFRDESDIDNLVNTISYRLAEMV